MKATWQGTTIAESDDTIVVEGNHYFPADSIWRECFRESDQHSHCPWKGDASYYDIAVGGTINDGQPGAIQIRRRRPLTSKAVSPSGKVLSLVTRAEGHS
jgi:hypothetical protein